MYQFYKVHFARYGSKNAIYEYCHWQKKIPRICIMIDLTCRLHHIIRKFYKIGILFFKIGLKSCYSVRPNLFLSARGKKKNNNIFCKKIDRKKNEDGEYISIYNAILTKDTVTISPG